MNRVIKNMFVLMCGLVMTMGFVACSDDEPTYSNSYHYRVQFASWAWQCDLTERAVVQEAFNQAVGNVGGETVNKVYNSPQDEAMKAKCEAVKSRYTNLTSEYMKFELLRVMSNSSNPAAEVKEVIAVYELGKSVQ